MILCRFLRGVFDEPFDEWARLLSLVTGWDVTAGELRGLLARAGVRGTGGLPKRAYTNNRGAAIVPRAMLSRIASSRTVLSAPTSRTAC